jgi:hypothetical protein
LRQEFSDIAGVSNQRKDFRHVHFAVIASQPLRRAGVMLIIFIALGAAALSLGSCTCADQFGNATDCPEF